jgi:L-threonylcarbamoyladenylate synthase
VVDASSDPPRVLRPGALGLEPLRSVVADLCYEPSEADEGAARVSPGLARKHYAPRARVVLADAKEIGTLLATSLTKGSTALAVVWSPEARADAPGAIVLPAAAEGYARELFAALHRAEESGADVVVIERPPEGPDWWAVVDRLRRAAST